MPFGTKGTRPRRCGRRLSKRKRRRARQDRSRCRRNNKLPPLLLGEGRGEGPCLAAVALQPAFVSKYDRWDGACFRKHGPSPQPSPKGRGRKTKKAFGSTFRRGVRWRTRC